MNVQRLSARLLLSAWVIGFSPVLGHAQATATETSTDISTIARPVTDAFLRGRVVSALEIEPELHVFDLEAKVENRIAYLSGTVDNPIQRDLAIETARGVRDLDDVRSTIAVEPEGQRPRERHRAAIGRHVDDIDTSSRVRSALQANVSIETSQIQVSSKAGIVVLKGRVGSSTQKALAERIARNAADSAIDLRNEITINP